MKLSLKQAQAVDDASDAYVEWREECGEVWDAYCAWTFSCSADAELAFSAYEAALDREEGAAAIYADRVRCADGLLERGLAHGRAGSRSWSS
jgi:hypothetical protein